MEFTENELQIINKVILEYPEDRYWNWCIYEFPIDNIPKLERYITLVREIIKRKFYYQKIYNWIYRRLFINKCIKS